MPFDDIFRDVLSSAIIVPEKKDFTSFRAIGGLVAGILVGAAMLHFAVSESVLFTLGVGGSAGYFLGVILVELIFWILMSAFFAISATLLFLLVG
ncbi:MAG: hypothetical protein AAFZ99_11830 [Pseudomonadota bacterium]